MSELEQTLLEMQRRTLTPEKIVKVFSDPLLAQEASIKLSELLAQICTLSMLLILDPSALKDKEAPASFVPSMTLPAEFSVYMLNASKTMEAADANPS